ncbi:agenet domain-containing protein [Striga asiatica]|uniref:Agenet domain-containing protein n=1 Tax=Striga asiatica TaxID=4170 RepID=A0A5A7R362_STRAF|nr:agenet domain-containing protein [Striga asiatica]
MQRAPPETPSKLFNKGDKIEVRKQNGAVVWLPATFLRSSQSQMQVQFENASDNGDQASRFRRENVESGNVRPAPPPELHRYLKVGEMVEGLCREKKGWRKGHVVEILENSRYTVSFEGEGQEDYVAEMEQWELRAFREWVDGFWVPPFLLQEVLQRTSSEPETKPTGLIVKIKCSTKASKPKFSDGMVVEVKSNEVGFEGSLYTAVIVKCISNDKFLVEHRALRTADKTELLRKEVDVSCIRPLPPFVQRVLPYEYFERVEAWYRDGWWAGHVIQVLNASRYMVQFTYTNEDMVFEHYKLRPHQEYVNGRWSALPKVSINDVKLETNKCDLKRKRGKKSSGPIFENKMVVEVKSDEEGYQGSWYTATIVCSLCSDKYLVEYQTLRTEDETQLLKENAHASYIRPCPPKIMRLDRFKMLEEVDAWYNDGWWVGLVLNVLDGLKYAVYFWTTDEELTFDHSNLRPHQEWIGGKWIVSFRKNLNFVTKNKLGKSKEDRQTGPEQYFASGMKVEVRSDEQGYIGSWYPAAIMKPLGNRKYLVEYLTLKANDGEAQLHKEEADAFCLRPRPPVLQRKQHYKPFEEVDAWYNEGWWVGRVYQALEGRKYSVYFDTTNEILEFQHSQLRTHQDWVDGQWVIPKKGVKSHSK